MGLAGLESEMDQRMWFRLWEQLVCVMVAWTARTQGKPKRLWSVKLQDVIL